MLVYATYLLSPWPPQYLAKLDGEGDVKFVEADNCFEIFFRNLQPNFFLKTILAAGPLSLKQAKSFARSGHILSRFILIIHTLFFVVIFSVKPSFNNSWLMGEYLRKTTRSNPS